MKNLQTAAINKAYNIFKKGTSQTNFEKAWRLIEINFPSLFTNVIIEKALIKANKYHRRNENILFPI